MLLHQEDFLALTFQSPVNEGAQLDAPGETLLSSDALEIDNVVSEQTTVDL
jgi:hypothetical protein